MNLIDKWTAMQAVQGIDSVATLRDGDPVIRMSAVEHVLENLPETEPDTTTHDSIPAKTGGNDDDGTSDDCISRQAAIDALLGITAMRNTIPLDSAIFNIKKLPSVQPDIIRCRNCKFASGDSRICMQFGHSSIGELDFCAWAERRTDG